MSLDIHTAVITSLILLSLFSISSFISGIRSIRSARHLPFFRLRRNKMVRGWRLLILAIFLIPVIALINFQLEPVIYRYFPPTITITLTPTMSLTPTISQTPTITPTPTITYTPDKSYTPTIAPTPYIPLSIEARFEGSTTPNPNSAFSEIIFTQGIDALYRPVAAGTEFNNPVGHLYGLYSYDQMADGSQWTSLWLRDGDLVFYETRVWDGGTGGYGYTDWNPTPSEWIPGNYEVQIFNGIQWKRSGQFTVIGTPPTPNPTSTQTPTGTPTKTKTPTRTPWPTSTPIPTKTPKPTFTSTLVPSITPTRTPYFSPTVTKTITPYPTLTRTPPTPSITPNPTLTRTPLTPTITPYPTLTRTPTAIPR
jgi:hypothetical protein